MFIGGSKMNKLRNIFLSLMTAVLVMAPTVKANAAEPINFYIFYGDGCPHCEAAMEYLDSLDEAERAKFNLIKYEVWANSDNASLMTSVAELMGEDTSKLGVPFMIIGDQTLVGYADNYSEDLITAAIDKAYKATDRYDLANKIDLSSGKVDDGSDTPTTTPDNSNGTSDATTLLALGIIVIGVVGLLVFAKVKTK